MVTIVHTKPDGLLKVDTERIVSTIDAQRGMFGHREGYSTDIPTSSLRQVLVANVTRDRIDLVFVTDQGALGFHRCQSKAPGTDGKWHPTVEILESLLASVQPPIPLETVASEATPGGVQWCEAGKKMGFWKSAAADLKQLDRAKSRVESAAPVQVRTYKDAQDYERDARKMLGAGWQIQAQSEGRGKVKTGSTALKAGVFLPWAVMRPARDGDPITVTWGQVPAAPPKADAPGADPNEDVFGSLERLGKLRDSGIISDDDFQAKKAELLSRL